MAGQNSPTNKNNIIMQNERTIQFWDDYYADRVQQDGHDHAQEWILQPTDALSRQILQPCLERFLGNISRQCDDDDRNTSEKQRTISILEIGCGTSALSKNILQFWQVEQRRDSDLGQQLAKVRLRILATDVSSTCIEHNLQRDNDDKVDNGDTTHSDKDTTGENNNFSSSKSCRNDDTLLQYATLNAVTPTASELQLLNEWKPFDCIFDKGGLDTFLFRSRHRGSDDSDHPVVSAILHNIFSWLCPQKGCYITISPRAKIKALRDYGGFGKMERHKLATATTTATSSDGSQAETMEHCAGDLESKKNLKKNNHGKDDNEEQQTPVYFSHICHVNGSFDPILDLEQKKKSDHLHPDDNECCAKCQILFRQFRGNRALTCKSAKAWSREWKGHQTHCKG